VSSWPRECAYFNQLTVPLRSLTIDVNRDHPNVFETLGRYSSKTLRELKVMGCQPVGDIDLYYVMKGCGSGGFTIGRVVHMVRTLIFKGIPRIKTLHEKVDGELVQ